MLHYGSAYSRCLRQVCGGLSGGGVSLQHRNGAAFTPSTSAFTAVGGVVSAGAALHTSVRGKATNIRIANRKKVEMFVAKRYHLPTRLRTAAPDIALEWDYEKNPMHLYPEIVGIGYMQPVFWKCRGCDHSYKMSVEKRVVRGGGCPVCEERELNRSMAQNDAFMERNLAGDATAEETPPLLPGEENRALRPKRTTVLNLRTKY
ncbi:putative mitochondrial hypothetical protein [Leptomonas pyrrhocoris]|uniref:Treble clef zinc finger domain-containing protein n=1 Tax=Leptomonas pyrrhocoris TaxID=157538 RepID=A0A0M9G525_LEPPY|nr:putative mitochondrial hypothetical protein [Leptomonas pyrrhocoris]KPA82417.1 putative mitochondrial hypothetical protein [Leptomonas pyrrhocoris]|eukprot:XP_015660856.1 putative mitochondrial hypothetical protein [Leptomonas pyrrhocoris]